MTTAATASTEPRAGRRRDGLLGVATGAYVAGATLLAAPPLRPALRRGTS